MSSLSKLSRKYLLLVLQMEWDRVQRGETPNPDVMKIALRVVEGGPRSKSVSDVVSWEEAILEGSSGEGSSEGPGADEANEGKHLGARRGSRISSGKELPSRIR